MSGNKSWDNQCEHTKAALIQQPETKEKNGRLSQAICENERVTKPLTVWVDVAGCCKTLIFRTWKSNSLFTLNLDFETFSFHFSLSISISRHFHFTFHSRNEWTRFSFHFSLLEMSEPDFHFTFHFLNFQYPLLQGTGPPPPSNPKKGWIYKPSRLKSIPPVHFCQALNYVATSFPSFSNPTKSIWAHGRIRWAHFDPFSVVAPHTKTEMQVSKNCGLHFDESV